MNTASPQTSCSRASIGGVFGRLTSAGCAQPGLLLAALLFAPVAEASHFRFSTLSWQRAAGTNHLAVEITITEAWREATDGIGSITYDFGDGSGFFNTLAATRVATLQDVNGERYEVFRTTIAHTYPSNGVYTVAGQNCCRIHNLVNADDADERLTMALDLRPTNTGSPVSTSPVIVQMQAGENFSLALPIADPDGDPFTVRMATSAESRIPAVASVGTNVLNVTPQGVLQWNTVGGERGQKFAAQVIIEENHPGDPAGAGHIPLDFIVELVDTLTNRPPTCAGPSGSISIPAESRYTATFTGTDPNGDRLRVNHQGLPPGATLTPVDGSTANSPMSVMFEWTPAIAQLGQSHAMLILFTDPQGLQGVCSFSLTVGPELPLPDFDLISTNRTGTGSGAGSSINPVVSRNGRYVAFASTAANLVTNDNNGKSDVFWRDRATGLTRLVSVNLAGGSGDGNSSAPVISDDGRYVAFQSQAGDLAPGDGNGAFDVYWRDMISNTTALVSVRTGGAGAGAGDSYAPKLARNGRVVAFASTADDLVTNDTNRTADVFVRDLDAGTTTLVSVGTNGVSGDGPSNPPVITPDGRHVAFLSRAGNLVTNDANGLNDVFRRDLVAGATVLVSVNTNGQSGDRLSFDPVISTNGGTVAFASQATDLTGTPDLNNASDVFVRDLFAQTTSLASINTAGTGSGNGPSGTPFFSRDGRLVHFITLASDLAPGDNNGAQDIILRGLLGGTNELISVNLAGTGTAAGISGATAASLSDDNRHFTFFSFAADLTPGDINDRPDVFVRDRTSRETRLLSRPPGSALSGDGGSFSPAISGDGRFVIFAGDAANLVANDTNGVNDVFAIKTTLAVPGFGTSDLALGIAGVTNGAVGSNVTLSVWVTNLSANAASSIRITNLVTTNLAVVSRTATTGSVSTNSGEWTLPSLAAGNSARLDVVVTPTSLGTAALHAGLAALDQTDSNNANHVVSHSVVVNRVGGVTFLGPVPYTSRTNSPWLATILTGLTELENFEDGQLSNNGVSASAGAPFSPGSITDSVDADDGNVDGSGTAGHSHFSASGSAGITFTFNAGILGALPTQAGVVWTDGGGTVSFEAFGPTGASLGAIGPFNLPDASFAGLTGEDHFFGVTYTNGISAIKIANTSGGIEVDHLQWTVQPGVSVPRGLLVWFTGNDATNSVAGTNTVQLANGAVFGGGLVGPAFQLDGIDDFAKVPNAATALPPALSVEFWFNSSRGLDTSSPFTPLWMMLEETDDAATTAKGLDFWYGGGALHFSVAQSVLQVSGVEMNTNIRSTISHAVNLASNTWQHVAGIFSGGVQKLYLNGLLVGSRSGVAAIAYVPAPILIGRAAYSGGSTSGPVQTRVPAALQIQVATTDYFFGGLMDELSLYERELSAATIAALHLQAARGKVLPEVAINSTGTSIQVSWPVFHSSFVLQQAAQIGSAGSWSTLSGPPATSNGVLLRSFPAGGAPSFYRLIQADPVTPAD